MDARLEIFGPLRVLDALALFILLLLDDVKLGLDALSASILLSRCKSFKFMCVTERVPRRRISVQNVLYALILDLHRLLVRDL